MESKNPKGKKVHTNSKSNSKAGRSGNPKSIQNNRKNPAKSGPKENRNHKKNNKNNTRGKRGRSTLSTVMMVIAGGVLLFSLYQIVMMVAPYYTGGQEYDKVKEMAVASPEDTDDGGRGEEGGGFQVDFEALLAQNPDTVAWIRMDEPAVISYPVVKSSDNEEYLTKTFSANDNKLGAIFLDMRNNTSFTDRNSFIYGHNLKVGGEMFSQLNAYADEEFCRQHPYFYIYTPDGAEKVYQVFSAGVVGADSDNYNITYSTEDIFLRYLELCKNSSNYQVDVDLNAGSRIVSLSTCTNVNDDERFLVQGVLIEER